MLIISKEKKYLKQIESIENELFKNNSLNYVEILDKSKNSIYHFYLEINQNKKVIGYVIFIDNNEFIEIEKIAVIKNFQLKKIGTKLLNKIKNLNKRIILEVSNRDKTIEFYLKNNFKIIHTRKNYYWDNSDAIILEFNPNI